MTESNLSRYNQTLLLAGHENILCGCDNTVIGSNIRRIREMTPAGVQQLARKYLRREDLVTVVAGAEKPAGM